MEITYNEKTDLLYIRIDDIRQEVINQRINDDIVLDIGENEKTVGIEIMNAKERLNLNKLFPLEIKNRIEVLK